MQKITGIVLAGGKSKRMGRKKALLKLNNKLFVQYSIECLQNFCDEIIISANTDDFDFLNLKIVKDLYPDAGPASGILSALKVSKNNINAILSCDTPFVPAGIFLYLHSFMSDFDAAVPVSNGLTENMICLINKSCADIIENEIMNDNLSFKLILQKLRVVYVDIAAHLSFYNSSMFLNVNTKKTFLLAQRYFETKVM